ncbi:MAG: hypothetical protein MJY95_08225 [Bacteroidaceae bacterium]|nr:hypothetical protein [Bacteroidaceae bacterium]
MNEPTFELRYGTPTYYKTIHTNDFDQAYRMFSKAKKFADSHRLTWTISLWQGGWLIKSITTKKNFLERIGQ